MAKNTATVYELMVAAQNNDSKAMLTLIKKFRPILVKYSMMLNYEDSYDDLQVFLIQKIMTIDLDTIVNRSDGGMVNYIKRIIHNKYVTIYEKMIYRQAREFVVKTEEDEELVENNNSDTDDYSSLLFNDLHLFLSPKEEQVIRCIFIFNMSTDEITKMTGISNWNIYKLKKSRLEKLRKQLVR